MRTWQKRLISSVIVSAVLAYAVVLFSGHHHWPIAANSGMWSGQLNDEFECELPYAVPVDAAADEFRVVGDQIGYPAIWIPFLFGKLLRYPHRSWAYDDIAASCSKTHPEDTETCASERVLEAALEYFAEGYDYFRAGKLKAGRDVSDQPPIRGLRLYRVRYRRTPPSAYTMLSKELVGEWSRSEDRSHDEP